MNNEPNPQGEAQAVPQWAVDAAAEFYKAIEPVLGKSGETIREHLAEFFAATSPAAAGQVQEWATLSELRSGAVFVDRNGTMAVKSAHDVGQFGERGIMCVHLSDGAVTGLSPDAEVCEFAPTIPATPATEREAILQTEIAQLERLLLKHGGHAADCALINAIGSRVLHEVASGIDEDTVPDMEETDCDCGWNALRAKIGQGTPLADAAEVAAAVRLVEAMKAGLLDGTGDGRTLSFDTESGKWFVGGWQVAEAGKGFYASLVLALAAVDGDGEGSDG